MKASGSQLVQISSFCAITLVLFTACRPAFAADLSSQTPAATPTPTELLYKYAAALDQFRSVIIKADITETYTNHLNGLRGAFISGRPGTSYHRYDYRTDGKRYAMQYQAWGDCTLREVTPESRPGYGFGTWDGDELYSNTHGTRNPGITELGNLTKEDVLTPLQRNAALGEMRGYLPIYRQRIDVMVRRGRSISVRPMTEPINGSACYVIDAVTEHGKICLWIDPAHGYLATRVTLNAGPGDLSGQSTINVNANNMAGRLKLPAGATDRRVLELTRFVQKSDAWVPVEMKSLRIADMKATQEFEHSCLTYKFTDVQLNPNHQALRSFDWKRDTELKDGTNVRKVGAQGVTLGFYRWQGGKLVQTPSPAPPRRGAEVR